MEACCATPAITREFARDATDGRSEIVASSSGRRGPSPGSMRTRALRLHDRRRQRQRSSGAAERVHVDDPAV